MAVEYESEYINGLTLRLRVRIVCETGGLCLSCGLDFESVLSCMGTYQRKVTHQGTHPLLESAF